MFERQTLLTVQQAAALADLLATTASKDETGEETIVTTIDLPEGQDFVVIADANVIGLARRLDAAGRERALAQAGVR